MAGRAHSHSRAAAAVGVALLLAALGWLLLRTSDEESTGVSKVPVASPAGEEVRSPVRLEGRAAGGEAGREGIAWNPGDPTHALRGVVRSPDGDPVPRATVFLLPKDLPGRDHIENRDRQTDADGRFDLGPTDPRGHWIGVVADGWFPGHLDGDRLVPGEEAAVVLAPGLSFRVIVRGPDGPPPSGSEIAVVPDLQDDRRRFEYPAPGSPWMTLVVVPIDDRGEGLARIGVDGPVAVEPIHPNHLATPQVARLPRPEGVVEFRLDRSCVLDLVVLDDSTGEPILVGFRFSVHRDGRQVNGGSTSLPGGRFPLASGLRTGAHRVRVATDWHRETESEEFFFETPGERREVVVRLPPAPSRGTLRLRLPEPAGEQGRLRIVLWRRTDGPSDAWERSHVGRRDGGDLLLEGLDPGRLDLLIAEDEGRRVAYHASVAVPAGAQATLLLEMRPGVRVEASKVPGVPGPRRGIRLRSSEVGDLPVYAVGRGWATLYGPDDPVPANAHLGPYPDAPR